MKCYRLHVLDLPQAFDDTVHGSVIIRSKKDTCGLQSFVYNIDVQDWAQKILSEKVFALGCPRKVVKQTINRETFFRSGRSSGRSLVMGVWT